MRFALVACLLLALPAIAGCADDASGGKSDDVAEAAKDLDLEATSTTGVIRGVVVDEAIAPLAEVKVVLLRPDGNLEVVTNEAGAFGFEDLPPGPYFLTASKTGFFETQQSVEVEAGVSEPAVTKIQLRANPQALPTFQVFEFQGFLECSFTAVFYFIPCSGVGDDKFSAGFTLSENASFIHVSLVWKPTKPAPASQDLYMNLYDDDDNYDIVAYTGGASPQVINADEETIAPLNDILGFMVEVAGDGEAGLPVGAQVQQGFNVYAVSFHGWVPPEGYAFWRDGEPKLPA